MSTFAACALLFAGCSRAVVVPDVFATDASSPEITASDVATASDVTTPDIQITDAAADTVPDRSNPADSTPPDTGPVCPTGSVCGTECVNLATDPAHCGDCSTRCSGADNGVATCESGACSVRCDADFAWQGGICVPIIRAPRLLAPLSTSTTTSLRPTLRWQLGAHSDGASIELCSDRPCTRVIYSTVVHDTYFVPVADLPHPGIVFWRLRGAAGDVLGSEMSPTWEFAVRARSAPVDTSWGSTLDLNGDGLADLAVATNNAEMARGRVDVFLSNGTSFVEPATTTLLGPDAGMAWYGGWLASAGDLDGDGYPELAVATNLDDFASGRVYLYAGSPTGIGTSPTWILDSPMRSAEFGGGIAAAGDVDGDGYGDLAIGAPQASFAMVYFGSSAGPSAPVMITIPRTPGGVTGGWCSSAGDVDGDGRGDVAIAGAEGGTYVYSFDASRSARMATHIDRWLPSVGALPADVNGDGYADVLLGDGYATHVYVHLGGPSGLSTTAAVTLADGDYNSLFGNARTGALDVDGDGFDDVLIGAPGFDSWTGRAYLYAGSASGLSPVPVATITIPSENGASLGDSVAAGGDMNGDGLGDIAVAATGGGRVTVWRGVVGSYLSAGSDVLHGTAAPSAGEHFGSAMAF